MIKNQKIIKICEEKFRAETWLVGKQLTITIECMCSVAPCIYFQFTTNLLATLHIHYVINSFYYE
jgi:hypothetical protein